MVLAHDGGGGGCDKDDDNHDSEDNGYEVVEVTTMKVMARVVAMTTRTVMTKIIMMIVVAMTTRTVMTKIIMMIVVVMNVGWCENKRKVKYPILLLSDATSPAYKKNAYDRE